MKLSLLGGNLVSPYFIILICCHKPMLLVTLYVYQWTLH